MNYKIGVIWYDISSEELWLKMSHNESTFGNSQMRDIYEQIAKQCSKEQSKLEEAASGK